jgi:hypothetical protein
VKLSIGDDMTGGVGEDTDTAKANFDAILAAVSRIPGAWDRLPAISSQRINSPLKIEFRKLVQSLREQTDGGESVALLDYRIDLPPAGGDWQVDVSIRVGEGEVERLSGAGNGAISAFVAALEKRLGLQIEIGEYAQQTLSEGTDAFAVTYVWVKIGEEAAWGMAEHTDTVSANFNAILSALRGIGQVQERLAVGEA